MPLISTRKPVGLTEAPALLTSNSSVFVRATKGEPTGIEKELNKVNPAEVMPARSLPLRRTAARPLSVANCLVSIDARLVAAALVGLRRDPARVRPFGNPWADRKARKKSESVRPGKIRIRTRSDGVMRVHLVAVQQDSPVVCAGVEQRGNGCRVQPRSPSHQENPCCPLKECGSVHVFFPIAQLSAGLRAALIEKNFFGQRTRGEFIRQRSRQIQRLRSHCESEQHVPPVQSRPVATEQVYGDRAVNLARQARVSRQPNGTQFGSIQVNKFIRAEQHLTVLIPRVRFR